MADSGKYVIDIRCVPTLASRYYFQPLSWIFQDFARLGSRFDLIFAMREFEFFPRLSAFLSASRH